MIGIKNSGFYVLNYMYNTPCMIILLLISLYYANLKKSISRENGTKLFIFIFIDEILMNPLFHTDFSISDSLKNVRKSVLIYETIINKTT